MPKFPLKDEYGRICGIPLLPGDRFSKLVVIERGGKRGHNWTWVCACDCGRTTSALASNLRAGNTKSCGCLKFETKPTLTHGLSNRRVYWQWQNMMRRCYSPECPAYPNYGGRGIRVDDRWHDASLFYEDVGDRPAGKTLDRVDNDGHYGPENWRWADWQTQQRNTRRNVFVTHGGVTRTVAEWSEIWGIPYARIQGRRAMGWPDSDLNLPKRPAGAKAKSILIA